MSSSLLPNDNASFLPITPTDGQRFSDAQGVQWIYCAQKRVWEKRGVVDSIPVATSTQPGLLPARLKKVIDRVPAVGGGFGIIADTKTILKSPTNPNGVITGDIKLVSESLRIRCVDAQSKKITPTCSSIEILDCGGENVTGNRAGLEFSLSTKFLNTLFIDAAGDNGKKGVDGEKGPTGIPGYDYTGPKGNRGSKGRDISTLCQLDGILINDIEGMADSAIVDLQIKDDNGHGCKLIVNKAKLNLEGNRPVDKLIATRLSRTIVYKPSDFESCTVNSLDKWQLKKAAGDTTRLNLQLVRFAKSPEGDVESPASFNSTISLNTFINGIVAEYKKRLQKVDNQWGQQVRQYINELDNKARTILSQLADDLTQCEFALPAIDYCITFEECGGPNPPPPPTPPPPTPPPPTPPPPTPPPTPPPVPPPAPPVPPPAPPVPPPAPPVPPPAPPVPPPAPPVPPPAPPVPPPAPPVPPPAPPVPPPAPPVPPPSSPQAQASKRATDVNLHQQNTSVQNVTIIGMGKRKWNIKL